MKKATAMERLLREGFFETKEAALPYLMSGAVYCGGVKVLNGGQKVDMALPMNVRGLNERYVGKGGYKLEGALADFGISAEGRVCIDAGACTGGFTDCMLQHGAACVYAIDVGKDQLDASLRQDSRVFSMEQTDIRTAQLPQADFIGTDVSFISLRLVLPHIFRLLKSGGTAVTLIKPQFEAGRQNLSKNGIVRDEKVRLRIRDDMAHFAEECGFRVSGVCPSPITGGDGNVEYLMCITKP